jgi:hypothetical protein
MAGIGQGEAAGRLEREAGRGAGVLNQLGDAQR